MTPKMFVSIVQSICYINHLQLQGSLVSAVLISAVPSLVQFTNRTKPHSIVLFPNLVRFSFLKNSKFDKKKPLKTFIFSVFFSILFLAAHKFSQY